MNGSLIKGTMNRRSSSVTVLRLSTMLEGVKI